MVKEAEKFASEDKKRRDAVETKNQAETMVYQTEKQLKEFEGKVRQRGGRGEWEDWAKRREGGLHGMNTHLVPVCAALVLCVCKLSTLLA